MSRREKFPSNSMKTKTKTRWRKHTISLCHRLGWSLQHGTPQLGIYKTIWLVVLIFSTSYACVQPLLMSECPADRQSLAAWDGNLILLRYRKRQRKFKIDNDSEGRKQWDNIINDYLLFQMSTEEAFGMGWGLDHWPVANIQRKRFLLSFSLSSLHVRYS